ncbi:hypothetical protein D3C77_785140 [compost metagenome]
MPINTEMKVATSISATVCISLSQSPTAPTRNSRPVITTVGRMRRVACQVMPATIASTSHQGVARRVPSR